MGLASGILSVLSENKVAKAENPQAYAKDAATGLLLGHPVSIRGKPHRSDNNIPYHATIKFFDKEKNKPEDAHSIASQLDLTPPNPKEVEIEPSKIKSREGHDIYTIALKGKHADKLKEHHSKFSHLGHPETYDWKAHISVPKEVHDEIKAKGHKTAHEAGIEFHPAELKQGPKTLHVYGQDKKLAASEKQKLEPLMKPWRSEQQRKWGHTAAGKKALGGNAAVHEWDEATKGKKLPERVSKKEDLEKGNLKNILTAGTMATALASPHTSEVKKPSQQPSRTVSSVSSTPNYSRQKMLNAISQVESSSGKNVHHKPTSHGVAYGRFALMPSVIHDTIRLNPDLKQYKKALNLQGEHLTHYMQDNPELEHAIAERHLKRLEHHFGQDPIKLGYAWNQGVVGTNRALKEKHDINKHPYVQKFKQAYDRSK